MIRLAVELQQFGFELLTYPVEYIFQERQSLLVEGFASTLHDKDQVNV
jgi:hypothetical protein